MTEVFNPNQYLEEIYTQLLSTERNKIGLTREWANQFPNKPGVYIIRDKEEIIYVGETGSIKGRMKDLIDTRNHTIRRSLGTHLYCKVDGFIKASSSLKFIDAIEDMLNEHIKTNLTIATLPVSLGRKELEEMVFLKNDPIHNRKGQRTTS